MNTIRESTLKLAEAIEWPGRWAVKVIAVDNDFPNPFYVPEAPQEDGKMGREQVMTYCAANGIAVGGKFVPTMAQAEIPEEGGITQED